ncbi:MAG: ribosome maturation factor RimM [Pseudobdellovibrionaceae bacterium]
MSSSQSSEFKIVGKVKEPHGLKGDLYILVFSHQADWFKKIDAVKIGDKDYKVTSSKTFKQGLIIQIQGLNDRTSADAFKGLSFAIPANLLISKPGETIYLSEILHFVLKNQQGQILGVIENFSSNGPQDLLVVNPSLLSDGPETGLAQLKNDKNQSNKTSNSLIFEVPFVSDWIIAIDFEQKFVQMDLPEGLVEVNIPEEKAVKTGANKNSKVEK